MELLFEQPSVILLVINTDSTDYMLLPLEYTLPFHYLCHSVSLGLGLDFLMEGIIPWGFATCNENNM